MPTLRDALDTARALSASGKAGEAESIYRQILEVVPAEPNSLYQLGLLEYGRGEREKAEMWLRKAVQAAPKSEFCWANLGVVLEERGLLEEAAGSYANALQINPTRPRLFFNLGNALRGLGRLEEAESAFRKALELDAKDADARHNLGALLKENGELTEAVMHLQEAVRLSPGMVDAYVNLGAALHGVGREEEALESFRRAAELAPGQLDAAAGEITVLERRGDLDAACEKLAALLEAGHRQPDLALVFAGLARRMGREDEALAMLEQTLGEPHLPPGKRQALLFARGKALDRRGEWEAAFNSYSAGNKLKRQQFDLATFKTFARQVRETFTPTFFQKARSSQERSRRPIFIVGMPRSGTSLIEQILASHPEVCGAGELPEIERLSLSLPARLEVPEPFPQCILQADEALLTQAAAEYLNFLTAIDAKSPRIVDKMPGNFMHLGFIHLLLPEAQVIHVRRNPVDTCISCFFQNFTSGHEYTYDLAMLGEVYGEYEQMMNHWQSALPRKPLEIVYEKLVHYQEAETRRLLEYCGLSWDERCLAFHQTKRVVRTASYDQVRQPIYTAAAGRSRHYEAYLSPLLKTLGRPL